MTELYGLDNKAIARLTKEQLLSAHHIAEHVVNGEFLLYLIELAIMECSIRTRDPGPDHDTNT